MTRYAILNTRKRVIVALVHTVVFLAVAVAGFFFTVQPLHNSSPRSAWALGGVYLIVTAVLVMLACAARVKERVYFSLCATSALFGLLRQIAGDATLFFAVSIRVALLSAAVLIGITMLREY